MDDNFLIDSYKKDITKKNTFINVNKKYEIELANKIQKAETKDVASYYVGKLIEPHYSYIVSIASKKYHSLDFPREVFDLSDFISWGNEGAIVAAYKFSPNKDIRFLSYAKHWIEAYIKSGVDKYKLTVYHPTNQHMNHYREKRVVDSFYNVNGYEPRKGDELVYVTSNQNEIDIEIKNGYVPEQFSFDEPIKEGDSTTFSDILVYEENHSDRMNSVMDELNVIFQKDIFSLKDQFIFKYLLNDGHIDDIVNNTMYINMFSKVVGNMADYDNNVQILLKKRIRFNLKKDYKMLYNLIMSDEWNKLINSSMFIIDKPVKVRHTNNRTCKKLQLVGWRLKEYI